MYNETAIDLPFAVELRDTTRYAFYSSKGTICLVLNDWLIDNVSEVWSFQPLLDYVMTPPGVVGRAAGIIFKFQSSQDAVLFKLTWC